MTSEETPAAADPDRDISMDTRRIHHNIGAQDIQGIRQKSLSRLVVLDAVVQYDFYTDGAAVQLWRERKRDSVTDCLMNFVCGLKPDDFDALATSARELYPEDVVGFLLGVSERTAWDYLKALRHFYT